jgi:TRAP-type mannitol/chloroaromatic compound transport system substrate-binding protein
MKYAAKSANQEMLDEYTARNNQALNELINKHDVKLRKLPDDVLRKLREISDEVIQDFIADDEMAQKVHASYSDFKDQVINYHRISEKAYIDTRELD